MKIDNKGRIELIHNIKDAISGKYGMESLTNNRKLVMHEVVRNMYLANWDTPLSHNGEILEYVNPSKVGTVCIIFPPHNFYTRINITEAFGDGVVRVVPIKVCEKPIPAEGLMTEAYYDAFRKYSVAEASIEKEVHAVVEFLTNIHTVTQLSNRMPEAMGYLPAGLETIYQEPPPSIPVYVPLTQDEIFEAARVASE